MAELIRVGRRSPGQRCAYCHGPLGAEPLATCAGCQVTLHAGCREELRGCLTPGCRGEGARERAPEAAPAPVVLPPAVEAALDAAHRQMLDRRRHEGRGPQVEVQGRAPGALARAGPYARLLLSATVTSVLALGLVGILGLLARTLWTWRAFDPPHAPFLFAPPLMAFAGAGLYFAGRWLRRLPGVGREVRHLLDQTRPVAMELSIHMEGSGRDRRVFAQLVGSGTRLRLELQSLLTPGWVWRRSGESVLVYGLPPPGPYLLEFRDGRLALVHPDD